MTDNPYLSGSFGREDDWMLAENDPVTQSVQSAVVAPVGRPAQRREPAPRVPVREARTNPFQEAFRATVGGLRDAVQGTADAIDDVAEFMDDQVYKRTGIGTYLVVGDLADNGVAQFVPFKEYERRTKTDGFGNLPQVAENQSTVGKVSREIVEFGASFVGGMRVVRGVGGAAAVARWGRPVVASAAAAFNDIDAMEGNLANTARDLGLPDNFLTEALAVEEDDHVLTARMKNAAADAVIGIPVDAAFGALARGIRHLRGAKAARQEIEETLAVPEEILTQPVAKIDEVPLAAQADEGIEVQLPNGQTVDVPNAAKAVPEAIPEQRVMAPEGNPIDEMETVGVEMANRLRGMTVEELDRVADDIMSGAPVREAAARERLGLHPGRIDFSRVLAEGEGPEALVEMVTRIAREAAPLAQALGSKPRSFDATQALAQLMGVDKGRIVNVWQEKTQNLDVFATAARMFVAGQAEQLVKAAEVAQQYAGSPDSKEWLEFMRQLDAQISLQAMVKGAASNMGRGLRSLGMTTKAAKRMQKAEMIRSALPNDRDIARGLTGDAALRRLADATTTGQREALVRRILDSRGNLRDVVKAVDRAQGPGRFQRATRELVTGWLFSVGTLTANVVGTTLWVGTRALSRFAVHPLGRALGKGMDREWVAAQMADTAYFSVMTASLARGFQNASRLIASDLLAEAQGIVAGSDKAVQWVGKGREWLQANYPTVQKFERIDAQRTREFFIEPSTVKSWMENANHGPAFFRYGLKSLIGVASGLVNATGASARLIRAGTIDVADELFGHTVIQAERMAQAAKHAAREGFDLGHTGDALKKYVDQRAKTLFDESSDELLEAIEKQVASGAKPGSKEVIELAEEARRVLEIEELSEQEARKVLFQDGLRWEINRGAAKFLPNLDGKTGLIFPFVQTPLRIMENVIEDLTPIGFLTSQEMRSRLMSGGPDAAVVAAQVTLGSMAISSAAVLAMNGMVVGHDGGSQSAARAVRPQYSIKIGDKWVEYNRFDPVGRLLGFGADLVQYEQRLSEEDVDNPHPHAEAAVKAMGLAIARNVLAGTWMTSARDIIALVQNSDGQIEAAAEALLGNTASKFSPAGGMARWWMGEDTDVLRESTNAWERVIAGSWWMNELPVKRDTLLGRPIPYDRVLGIKVKGETDDALLNELAEIGFDLPPDSKSFRGVDLSAQQLSRLKELRGQVVEINGRTFEEDLRRLITTPEWRSMSDGQKADEISERRRAYHEKAIKVLRKEDREFGASVRAEKRRRELLGSGMSPRAASTEVQRFKEELLGRQ